MGWTMLKKRIIPIQLLQDENLVKTKQFDNSRHVGEPVSSSKIYNAQYADELIFLNIDSNVELSSLLKLIENVSKHCFMPLSFGGGIRNLEDVKQLISKGADKVVLNSITYNNPQLISDIAQIYGSQAIIVCIDVRLEGGSYQLFSNSGNQHEPISLEAHIKQIEEQGAGEIMIQSIDRDGCMQGMDLDLIKRVTQITKLPVIACGGAGDYSHLKDAFLCSDISAVACGSIFNFSDSNLIRAKAYLSNYQLAFKKV